MRQITSHKANVLNECIVVEALDGPGAGGASHEYRISGFKGPLDHHPIPTIDIRFQNGPINEVGANGVTNEALLAVVIDRLEGFQSGPFACDENQLALEHARCAMEALRSRTKGRVARGVEGTHQK
ncbi:MAG TPA: hypothetical protein VEI97_17280 [bacterium]|nr:hypothetical protein [bacterium]